MHSVRVITQDHLHFQDKLEPNDEHAIARMVARPPQTPRSDAGSVAGSESRGSSRLSVASRSNLEGLQGRQKITTLIEIKVQMDATASGKSLGKHARHRLHKTAKHQAHGVLAECHMDLDGLPGKMGPGCFRPGSMPAQLAAAISEAAVITALAINAPPPPTTPAPIEEDPEPIAAPEPEPSKIFERERRLPAINVAGKMVPLETVIRDKVMARGGGGAHQLRKMFQVFDTDGTGTVTAIEMDCFLRHNNIKINNKSLAKFFETWASERQRGDMEMKGIDDGDNSSLNYLEFIEKILPADYPHRENMYADDIASIANQHRKKPMQSNEIASVREYIPAFQEKIASKSRGGGAELRRMFAMFDVTKKGYVTFDDLITGAKRWNVEATPQVRAGVQKVWCPLPEDKGVISFDAFVERVLPRDFTDLKALQRVFFEKITLNSGAMQEVFRRIDQDHGGTIDKDEIIAELHRMNIQVTPELAHEFAKNFDEDGDGEIDFAEFSRAVRNMDPDRQNGKVKASNVGMLWEADQYARQRINAHRPNTAESLCSVAGDVVDAEREKMQLMLQKQGYDERPIAGSPLRNEELRDYTMPGKSGEVVVLDDGTCLVDGVPTDFVALLRDKIYAKFRAGFSPLRRLFKAMDAEGDGKITMSEFGRFLEPYNLNLSNNAVGRLMKTFDKDGDGSIDYDEFCKEIVPDNYHTVMIQDHNTGVMKEKMQGVPAMVWQPPRHFAQHKTPTVLAPFDSKAVPPFPADSRAINLIREKVAQRSKNANDARAHNQLRDALQLYDRAKDGKIPRLRFREVLERYSVFLRDEEFDGLCKPLTGRDPLHKHKVSYKPFLAAVLVKPRAAGAFGPHVPAPWMRRAAMAREEQLLELDRQHMISTPMSNRAGSRMGVLGSKSARGATPRSVRLDALDELSKNMYHTSRVVPKRYGGAIVGGLHVGGP